MAKSVQRDRYWLLSEFCCEVEDLIRNGYKFLFSSDVAGVQIIKLRHLRNGRVLKATCSATEYSLIEDGKILKQVKLS